MFCFACSLVRPKNREFFNAISLGIVTISFALVMIGALAFGQDLHQLLVISHVHLVLQCLLFAMAFFKSIRGRRLGHDRLADKANKPILVAFFILLAFALVDFVMYVAANRDDTDPAQFTRLGLFVFITVVAVEAFKTSIDYMRRADRIEEIETMAYTDALSGIANRTAWEIMVKKIDDAIKEGITKDALVCQLDVNNLKTVNGTLGHGAGDEYIRRAASTVKRSFGTEGTCYRTGGDEFSVLLLGVSLDERARRCLELMRGFEDEWREDGGSDVLPPLSIACGMARTSECEENDVSAAQELADKRMYDNKRAMKASRVNG